MNEEEGEVVAKMADESESLSSLIAMGFPERQAKAALLKCDNNVEHAVNYIMSNPAGEAGATEGGDTPMADASTEAAAAAPAVASSYVCNEVKSMQINGSVANPNPKCGKILKDTTSVQIHAEKSGHSDFGESTVEVLSLCPSSSILHHHNFR
jgi:hypothetical protein